ncbi:glycoside hydrolase superfamily, partial [Thamnocephalis sphaerospora]
SPDLHKSFYGLTYTPQNAQYPGCGASLGDVIEDYKVLWQLTPRVRLYGMDCDVADLSIQAVDLLKVDISLVLTIWVDKNAETYDRQVKTLMDTLKKHGSKRIIGVSVGNEALYREDVTASDLSSRLNKIRTQLSAAGYSGIPVYTTDLANNYNDQLATASDALLGNIHPFFAGVSVSGAAQWSWNFFRDQFGKFSKPAIISETGWPTRGKAMNSAVPSVQALQQYVDDFVCASNQRAIQYYFFEAFDAVWKTDKDDVEKSWGLLDKNRKPKVKMPKC